MNKKKEDDYARLTVRVVKEDLKKFKMLAMINNSDMSSIINKCIQNYIEKEGAEHNLLNKI